MLCDDDDYDVVVITGLIVCVFMISQRLMECVVIVYLLSHLKMKVLDYYLCDFSEYHYGIKRSM